MEGATLYNTAIASAERSVLGALIVLGTEAHHTFKLDLAQPTPTSSDLYNQDKKGCSFRIAKNLLKSHQFSAMNLAHVAHIPCVSGGSQW